MPLVHLAVVAVIVGATGAHAARVAVGEAEENNGAEQDSSRADARATVKFQPKVVAVAAWALAAAGPHGGVPESNSPAAVPGASLNGFAGIPQNGSADTVAKISPPTGVAIDGMVQPTPSEIEALKSLYGRLFLGVGCHVVGYEFGSIAPISGFVTFSRHLQVAEYDLEHTPNKTGKPTIFVLDGSSQGQVITDNSSLPKGWMLFGPETKFEVVNKPQVQEEVAALWARNWEKGIKFNGRRTYRKKPKRSPFGRVLELTPPMPFNVVCIKELEIGKA